MSSVNAKGYRCDQEPVFVWNALSCYPGVMADKEEPKRMQVLPPVICSTVVIQFKCLQTSDRKSKRPRKRSPKKNLRHTCSCCLCPTLSKHSAYRSPSSSPPSPFCGARDPLHTQKVQRECQCKGWSENGFRIRAVSLSTWATQMNMLVFIIGAAPEAPGVIGQSEQILQPRRVGDGLVQALCPLLTLLEGWKVASVEQKVQRFNYKTQLITTLKNKNKRNGKLTMFELNYSF